MSVQPSYELILHRHEDTETQDLVSMGLGVWTVYSCTLERANRSQWVRAPAMEDEEVDVLGRAMCDEETGMMHAELFTSDDISPTMKEPFGLRRRLELWGYKVRTLDVRGIKSAGVPSVVVSAMDRNIAIAERWLASMAPSTYEHGYIYSKSVEGRPRIYFSDCSEKQYKELYGIWRGNGDFSRHPLLVEADAKFMGLIQHNKVAFSVHTSELDVFFQHGELRKVGGEEEEKGTPASGLSRQQQKKKEYQKRRKTAKSARSKMRNDIIEVLQIVEHQDTTNRKVENMVENAAKEIWVAKR